MNRIAKYILFVFFITGIIEPMLIALAEQTAAEGVIVRPAMEYNSSKLRDPFNTYLVKEEPKPVEQESTELAKPEEFDLNKLKLQGVIWGVKMPQAIINDKVLKVGDLIEGAEILSIEKKGITLSFNGVILDLAAPGQKSVKVNPEAK